MDCVIAMEPATSAAFASSYDIQRNPQVVPQLQPVTTTGDSDESNIHKLALSLANPSPVAQKSFEFGPSGAHKMDTGSIESLFPGSPRGFFSPNSGGAAFNIFSMMTPTPTTQHGASPFVFGVANASPYLSGAGQAPMTPQTTLQALTNPVLSQGARPGGSQLQSSSGPSQPPSQSQAQLQSQQDKVVQGPVLPPSIAAALAAKTAQQQQQPTQSLPPQPSPSASSTASASLQVQKTAPPTATGAHTPRGAAASAGPKSSAVRVKQEQQAMSEQTEDSEHEMDAEEEEDENYEDQVPSSEEESDSSFKHKDQAGKRRKRKASGHHGISSGARCFEDLTDDDIAFMDFKELTRLMNAAGLSRQAIAETKARRRRLKNRQSARLCSNKKRELCNELASDKQRLQDELKALQQAHTKLQREYSHLRQQYEILASGNKRARDH